MSSPESVPSTVIVVLAGSSAVIIRTISHYLSRARPCRLGTKPNNARSLKFVCTCGTSTAPGVRRRQRVTSCRGKCRVAVEGVDQVEVERAVMRTHLRRGPGASSFLRIVCAAPWPMCRWTADAVARAATKSPSRAQTRQKKPRETWQAPCLMQNPNRTIAGVQGCPSVSRKRGWL